MIKITLENIAELGKSFSDARTWFPQYLDANMQGLGRRIAYLMRQEVRLHSYKGSLSDSIQSGYDPAAVRVTIGPTAKRGRWDAGLLLEMGTGPIEHAPFGPIADWAEFRGLPAGPIWMKIRQRGIDAHPFLKQTLERGDTAVAIRNTAQRLGLELAGRAVLKE